MLKIREDLARSFPELEVLELELRGLRISEKDQRIEKLKITIQEEIRRSFPTLDQIKSYPIFRCYRDFFWRVGIDPTKNRPAAEALTRRVVSGKDLPTINTLVDSYNLASIKTSVAIAAFDLNKISGSSHNEEGNCWRDLPRDRDEIRDETERSGNRNRGEQDKPSHSSVSIQGFG